MKLQGRRIHPVLRRMPRLLMWAMLLGLRAAGMGPGNVLVYDSDPFVARGASLLASYEAPDWSSLPGPVPGPVDVSVERWSPVAGLGGAVRRSLGLSPAGARFVLVNQVAPDIAFFNFSGRPAPVSEGDVNRNGIDDAWELRFFGAVNVNPDGDADADGFTNLAEYEAGSDPTRAENQPPMEGLVARWLCNRDVQDLVGGHHGVWVGSEGYGDGHSGAGLALSQGRHVRVPGQAALRPFRALTLAAWVKSERLDGQPHPVLAYPSARDGISAYALILDSQGPRLQLGFEAASTLEGPIVQLIAGEWYHLAASWDGATIRMYINGKPAHVVRGGLASGLAYGLGRDLLIGSDGHTGVFDGVVDEVTIADRVLGADEIRWLAGGNRGPRGAVPSDGILVERTDQTAWLMRSDGSEGRFLTYGAGFQLAGDRSRLLFRRVNPEPARGAAEVLMVRDLVRGGESVLAELEDAGGAAAFDWAPDGSVWVTRRASQVVGRIPRGGGALKQVLGAGELRGEPAELAVSRSNGRLAWFNQGFGVDNGVPWVAGLEGEGAQPIPGTSVQEPRMQLRHPAWSADGTRLAFRQGAGLISMKAGGLDQQVVFGGPEPGLGVQVHDAPAAWLPDGSRLVSVLSVDGQGLATRLAGVATDGSGRVEVMEPGLGSLKRVVYAGAFEARALDLRIELEWQPAVGAGLAELRLTVPAQGPVVAVEAVEGLGGDWREVVPQVRQEGSRRILVIPVEPGLPARFFRLRR